MTPRACPRHAWAVERRRGGPVLACRFCAVVMSERACREVVAVRSGGVCEICGEQRAATMHHRLARRFGPWSPSNIVHLCGDGTRGCHGRVTSTREVFYEHGWLIRTWDRRAPGEVPFLHWLWGAVLLDEVGDYHRRGDAA